MKNAQDAGVSIEDLARTLASMDGQLGAFDEGRDRNDLGVGVSAHHINRAEEPGLARLLDPATCGGRCTDGRCGDARAGSGQCQF
jgi:hypothetical protein